MCFEQLPSHFLSCDEKDDEIESLILMMELSRNAKFWTQIFLRSLSFVIIPQEQLKTAETSSQGYNDVSLLAVCYERVRSSLIWRDVQVLPPPVEESQVVSASGCSTNFVQVIPNTTHMTVT